ncbi:hypothetical protein NFI96_030658 [Prochilodus magdalenae]|nr:hypothetical protein NFI96_030658 [Prochilodus magdalenae]
MDGCRVPRRYTRKGGFNVERQICRQFINGSCRYGQRCYYLHEWPTVPSVQVCRYFQKGGCWFGDNCRYLHIPCTASEASGGRRGSAPVVHSSAFAGHSLTDRRGSEPSLLAVQGAHSSFRRGSEPLVASFISQQQNLQHPSAGIAEEEEDAVAEARSISYHQDEGQQSSYAGPSNSHGIESGGSMSHAACAAVQENMVSKPDKQETSLQDGLESGATASAEQEQSEAYKNSKDVVCGICMDKVYEKPTERERRFGILPKCSHAFCLGCIMTWRKTKEFQEEVIKACPQCRVKSSFYIPSKYWVCEDEPKAALIASFKEKSSKVKCNFFMRHGCCPFASECIFSHELPPGHRPQRRPFRPKLAANASSVGKPSIMSSLLNGFQGPSRLLAHALLTGGVNGAQKVLNKLRGANSVFSLRYFLERLCGDEASLEQDTQTLATKPLVCLFPDAFKRDLLCLLHLSHSWVPRDSVLALLHCLDQEVNQKPWILALIRQLQRDIGDEDLGENSLFTQECVMRLKGLCEKFKDSQTKGGWELYLNEHRTEVLADSETEIDHKKRKSEVIDLDMDTDLDEPKTKRMKLDLPASEDGERGKVAEDEEEIDMHLFCGPEGRSPPGEESQHEGSLSVLPERIKWDESCTPTLTVLNECDSKQLEVLCELLGLSEAPEQALPNFCSLLLSLTPDLSHSTAAIIIKNLLLGKVLSLVEPASRSLVTAATSLCSRYPRATCQALIEPIIKEGQTGSTQAELLCRLVKDCLEPHHRLLVFEMTLVGEWNDGLLSVIHATLDSKIELNEELFSLFVNRLNSQSPHFTKSMKFAKMMLTVLTRFHSHCTKQDFSVSQITICPSAIFLLDSKVSRDTLYEAVREVQAGSISKRRKFLESVELQISLKNYDPQKDKRFSGTVRLKTTPRPKFSVCVLGDQQHCDEAKAAEISHMDIEALKKLNKNKKLVKKLAKKYDAFLASESLIKQIPRILGPGLNKAGKFPSLLTHNENLITKVDEVKSTIKFQMKKVLCLAVAVGHVRMSEDELVYNIHLAVNFLVSLLKKNWQNVRALYVKSTMGKPQRLY